MSRWQEFGFPDQLKFTSPLKAMQGITLAVEERLRPAYPELADEWYAGESYQQLFIHRSLGYMYPIEKDFPLHYLSQSTAFPLRLPNKSLINFLSTLERRMAFNNTVNVHGFWDYSKNASGIKSMTETEFNNCCTIIQDNFTVTDAEDGCHFYLIETQEMPERFRFQPAFSEQYFLYLYNTINPLKSYLTFHVRTQTDGTERYNYEAQPINNLNFSD